MESRNRIDSSMPRIPFATVAGDGWYNEHLDLRWHDQHLSSFNHYNHAISELNGTNTKRRGRPRKTKPEEAIDEAVKASAIVEHASWRDGQLLPRTIHCKRDFKLRKIKEALYIRHNHVINRDKGKDVSDIWTNLILGNQLCTTST
ncbi:hypothetical protein M514_08864, partial [Trichuris suis]